jgi:hypothetical protein
MVAELRKKLVRIFSRQLKVHIAREDFEELRAEHLLILGSENASNQPFEFFPGHNLCMCSLSCEFQRTDDLHFGLKSTYKLLGGKAALDKTSFQFFPRVMEDFVYVVAVGPQSIGN